jgi:hypothetical protein
MLTIFSERGGQGVSVKTGYSLSHEQRRAVLQKVGEEIEPLIVGLREDVCFVITSKQLIVCNEGKIRLTNLDEILSLERPKSAADLADGKFLFGRIELRLKDGSTFEVESDPGAPYIGLVSVFRYVVKMNRGHSS